MKVSPFLIIKYNDLNVHGYNSVNVKYHLPGHIVSPLKVKICALVSSPAAFIKYSDKNHLK